MAKYIVKQGDCILSIAYDHGLFWETVWNHAENSQLKQKRKDPNVLYPGDEVFVPDKEEKQESCACEQKHQFRKKGVPAKIKIKFLFNDNPRANEQYKLYVDDMLIKEGKTKHDGFIEESIPPNAKTGEIVLIDKEGNEARYLFKFGTVDPLDTEDGIRGRLTNLGYNVDDGLNKGISAFQTKQGLEVTGEVDDTTRIKLKERFGR